MHTTVCGSNIPNILNDIRIIQRKKIVLESFTVYLYNEKKKIYVLRVVHRANQTTYFFDNDRFCRKIVGTCKKRP